MATKKITDKIAKVKAQAKDTVTKPLAVPTGSKAYSSTNSPGYKALNAAGKVKKTITTPGGKNDAFSTGTQKYKKSELAAAGRLAASGKKATKTAITVKGAQIASDRAKTASRADIVAMNLKKKKGK